MSETIFDKILAGDIPCYKLYEDDHVLAFLDIGPLSLGHTLVIPKERAAFLHQLSDESAAAIGRVLPRLARAVLAATGATAYNVLQNNGSDAHQVVMHVHFHIIPRVAGRGLGIGWQGGSLDAATAAELVTRIRAELELTQQTQLVDDLAENGRR
jgi:histidine triad (HIT) family protein